MPWAELAVSTAIITLLAIVATTYFRKVEDDFADII
jgi:hypothetical protein